MSCCQCLGSMGDSPSPDFCGERCQQDWAVGVPCELSVRRRVLMDLTADTGGLPAFEVIIRLDQDRRRSAGLPVLTPYS